MGRLLIRLYCTGGFWGLIRGRQEHKSIKHGQLETTSDITDEE